MMSSNSKKTLFIGRIFHCTSLTTIEEFSSLAVDEKGIIVYISKDNNEDIRGVLGWTEQEVETINIIENQFLFPGFIGMLQAILIKQSYLTYNFLITRSDTHIHASQYANAGIFGKSTLLDWLETYTFPLESSLADATKARLVYDRCIRRTLSNGTTTASYYATTSVSSTNILADLCLTAGQRAFVGRCCMDSSLQPEWYKDATPASALADTIATIDYVDKLDPSYKLISPIITPRFAPSCTSETMSLLGNLAKERNLPIQTHISENVNEIALVKEMFPSHKHYTDVYDKHALLTPRTILAHAVHLSSDECAIIKARGSKVSHCPASNSAITSGTCKVRQLLSYGIEVGLGTDMSGGYSPSILEAVRQALLVSRHVAMSGDEAAKLSVEECLYLATRGGARVVGLEERIGGFGIGMEFDAQLIDLGGNVAGTSGPYNQPVDIFGWETWDNRIAKWVFGGDDRNTIAVWVKGRLVHETDKFTR